MNNLLKSVLYTNVLHPLHFLTFSHEMRLRVQPPKIVWHNVSMALWRPYAVWTESVSTTGGLLELVDIIDGVHHATGDAHTMPMLLDVNIFYRVVKLMLSENWTAPPVRRVAWVQALCDTVLPAHRAFLGCHPVTHFSAVTCNDKVPPSPPFGHHGDPHLCTVHRAQRCGPHDHQHYPGSKSGFTKASGGGRCPSRGWDRRFRRHAAGYVCSYALRQLECIQFFVTPYVPALFLMGIWVRDCHWNLHTTSTGSHVHSLLRLQATFLVAPWLKQGRHQYLANTPLALLTGNPIWTRSLRGARRSWRLPSAS